MDISLSTNPTVRQLADARILECMQELEANARWVADRIHIKKVEFEGVFKALREFDNLSPAGAAPEIPPNTAGPSTRAEPACNNLSSPIASGSGVQAKVPSNPQTPSVPQGPTTLTRKKQTPSAQLRTLEKLSGCPSPDNSGTSSIQPGSNNSAACDINTINSQNEPGGPMANAPPKESIRTSVGEFEEACRFLQNWAAPSPQPKSNNTSKNVPSPNPDAQLAMTSMQQRKSNNASTSSPCPDPEGQSAMTSMSQLKSSNASKSSPCPTSSSSYIQNANTKYSIVLHILDKLNEQGQTVREMLEVNEALRARLGQIFELTSASSLPENRQMLEQALINQHEEIVNFGKASTKLYEFMRHQVKQTKTNMTVTEGQGQRAGTPNMTSQVSPSSQLPVCPDSISGCIEITDDEDDDCCEISEFP